MQNYKDKDRDYHDVIGNEYHQIVVEPRELINSLLFEEIDRQLSGGETMLDVGCGTGHMLIRFGERYATLVGVDHSRAMLDDAAANLSIAGLQVDLIKDEVGRFLQSRALESRYDLITCTGFLHHLDPDEFQQVLRNIRRLLGSNGLTFPLQGSQFQRDKNTISSCL